MVTQSQNRSAQHLQRIITTRNGSIPNFALLLGAGASKTSNVKTAVELIDDWRRTRFESSSTEMTYQRWLQNQPWYGHDDEYSILFEFIYDQPSQRRVFVEECVKEAKPNWGYVYLTGLLQRHYFDVVFTTNFDDLINEACYIYSDGLRPIVAAHDSAVQGIRVTAGRPKIIKLHGDFLYDDIKNTVSELDTLETNTKRKLHQFAQEYGLIVMGYSGRDKSVMDTLDVLLRDEENYKHGIYWCRLPGEEPSARLASLCRRDRVYLVEIPGFDEFLAELYEKSGQLLPKTMAQPFEMAKERVDLFARANAKLDLHPVISQHKTALLASIANDVPQLPLPLQAAFAASAGYPEESVLLWKKAVAEEPNDSDLAMRFATLLVDQEKIEDLRDFVYTSALDADDRSYLLLRAYLNDDVVSLSTKHLNSPSSTIDGAVLGDENIVRINRAIANKRLGNTCALQLDLKQLDDCGATDENANIRAGAAALRRDKDAMFAALEEALFNTVSPMQLMIFPVFEDYREDDDFVAFVEESHDAALDRRRRRRYHKGTEE